MKPKLEIEFSFWAHPSEVNLAINVKKEKEIEVCAEKKKTKTMVASKPKNISPPKVNVKNNSVPQIIVGPPKEIVIKREPTASDFIKKTPQNIKSIKLEKVLNSLKRKATDVSDNNDLSNGKPTAKNSNFNSLKRRSTDETAESNKSDEIKSPNPKIRLKMRRTTADCRYEPSSHDSYVIVQPQPAMTSSENASSVVEVKSSNYSDGCRLDNLNFIKATNVESDGTLPPECSKNKPGNTKTAREIPEKKTSRRKMKRPERFEEDSLKERDQSKNEVTTGRSSEPPVNMRPKEDVRSKDAAGSLSLFPFPVNTFHSAKDFKVEQIRQANATSFKATSSFETPPIHSSLQTNNKTILLPSTYMDHQIDQSRHRHAQQATNQGSKAVLLAEKFDHSRTPPSDEKFRYKDQNVMRSPEHQKLHANALQMARKLFKDVRPHQDKFEKQDYQLPKRGISPSLKVEFNQPISVAVSTNKNNFSVMNANKTNFDVINAHLQKHKAVLSTRKSQQSSLNNSNSINNFNVKPMNGNQTIRPNSIVAAHQLNGNNMQFAFQQNKLNQLHRGLKKLNHSASNVTNAYQIQKPFTVAQNSQRARQVAGTSSNVRNIAKKYLNVGNTNNFVAKNQRPASQTYNISTIDLNLLQKQLSGNKAFVTTVGNQGKLLGNGQTMGAMKLVQVQQPVQIQKAKGNISYQGDQSAGNSVRWTQNCSKIAVVQAPPPIIRFTDPKKNLVPMTTNVQTVALESKPSTSSSGRVHTQDTPIDFSKNKKS